MNIVMILKRFVDVISHVDVMTDVMIVMSK